MSEKQDHSLDPRDHRSLGTRLKLFMFDDSTPGMPFWLPKGAQMRKRIEDVIYKAHKARGYEPVLSPAMMEDTMWKTSGHYDNYKENMFPSEVEKRDYLLKPMNCPMHVIMYQSDVRSYHHLPMRYFEFGQVHRNENSGSLHGLFRVREFTQDDAHIFCTENQIHDEIIGVMEFVEAMLSAFGFEHEINLSTKPEKAIGDDAVWEKAEGAIESALKEMGLKYILNEGDGAFYGPKIDIKIKDNHGREWQLGTVQIDFNLPERFKMEYVGEDGKYHRPVMIHRAICGSIERFIGILLEHQEGLMPVAVSPYQVAIVPISGESEKQMEYVDEVKSILNGVGADVVVYDDNNTLNKRIKMAEEDKNPIVMILGDKEVDERSVNLRHKVKQKRYQEDLSQFKYNLIDEMNLTI
jgi:threonyl-tRNA synthetase